MKHRLQQIFLDLLAETKTGGPGQWQWIQLKNGALIALRVLPDLGHRHELRIARKAETAGEPWEREVETFLKAWNIEATDGKRPCTTINQWWRHHQLHAAGKVETQLLELRRGECKPGKALCWPCLIQDRKRTEVPWFAMANESGQRCNPHALEYGRSLLGASRKVGT